MEILEERLRVIEGGGSSRFGDAVGLCLVPDVIIPPKFKVPEFEKYKDTSCPKNHLTMYCRKMAAHAYDEKLLIHFFQDSLAGVALNWYIYLEPTHIRSWKDLVDAFLKQYKYNIDMAPDKIQLQNMVKQSVETFKEYAKKLGFNYGKKKESPGSFYYAILEALPIRCEYCTNISTKFSLISTRISTSTYSS